MLPSWLVENPDAIQTGSLAVDQLLQVLLGTSMVLAFLIGFLLDNTIPGDDKIACNFRRRFSNSLKTFEGTPEERGLVLWESQLQANDDLSIPGNKHVLKLYDLPIGMSILRRYVSFF